MTTWKAKLITLWRASRDILFRLKLYRGIRISSPEDLIACVLLPKANSGLTVTYRLEVDYAHPLGEWLLEDCEGPWAIGLRRPACKRERFVAFSRPEDASLFCMLMN
jgi:hypothetical protein